MYELRVKPRALITGVGGQAGSYLAELLLQRGYEVYGIVRRNPAVSPNSDHVQEGHIKLCEADLLDEISILNVLKAVRPNQLYNLAAPSFAGASWTQPLLTAESIGLGVIRLLEAVRLVDPTIRFFQASSSEMFGRVEESPQTEHTHFSPRNPYGIAKLYAHWCTVTYRETYNLFACSGILYNQASPRCGSQFLIRKVTEGAARISAGLARELKLGNLDASRDWAFAGDCVEAMWLMLQQPVPEDYIVATGKSHTVQDACDVAFSHVGLRWQDHVVVDPALVRPAERANLIGDASKANRALGWAPRVGFEELVRSMVDADVRRLASAPAQRVTA